MNPLSGSRGKRDVEAKTKARDVWFAGGIRFQCQLCGKCCRGEPGFVWVTADEISRMARHLELPRDEFVTTYVRREDMGFSLRERADGDCVLWSRKCTVYPCRPSQCRTFPFWKHGLTSEEAFAAVNRGCPGVGKGRLYTCEEILAIASAQRDT
jgi:hypothetical protein